MSLKLKEGKSTDRQDYCITLKQIIHFYAVGE